MPQMSGRRVGIELEYTTPVSQRLVNLMKRVSRGMEFPLINRWKLSSSGHWSCSDKASDPKALVLKSDGSASIEINTPFTGNLAAVHKGLKILQAELPYLFPYPITPSCGMHVHVDICDLSDKQVLQALNEYLRAEHHLFSILPETRQDNGFCEAIAGNVDTDYFHTLRSSNNKNQKPTRYEEEEETEEDLDHMCRSYIQDMPADKDTALSFITFEEYRTLEFRLGAPSYIAEDIVNWACMCRNIIQKGAWTKATYHPNKGLLLKDFLHKYCPGPLRKWYLTKKKQQVEYSHSVCNGLDWDC